VNPVNSNPRYPRKRTKCGERERERERLTAENAENQRRNPQRITRRRNCVAMRTRLQIKARSFGLDRFRPCWSKPNVRWQSQCNVNPRRARARFDMTINTATRCRTKHTAAHITQLIRFSASPLRITRRVCSVAAGSERGLMRADTRRPRELR